MDTLKSKSLIDKSVVTFISGYNMMVLRDKGTRRALNVSYTEDGLKWTADRQGNLLYYHKARLFTRPTGTDDSGNTTYHYTIKGATNADGTLKKSKRVYVEKFIPKEHFVKIKDRYSNDEKIVVNHWNMKSEYNIINRAQSMIKIRSAEL